MLATAIGMLRRVRDEAPGSARDAIAGVGIAAPGPLDSSAGALVEPPNMPRSFRGAALAGPIGAALLVALPRRSATPTSRRLRSGSSGQRGDSETSST